MLVWLTTQRSSRAIRLSAEYAAPATTSGTGSPNRRLNSRTTRSGSVSPRRSALSPTTYDESSDRNSTDGTCMVRLPRPTMAGSDPLTTAAAANAVPRSTASRYTMSHLEAPILAWGQRSRDVGPTAERASLSAGRGALDSGVVVLDGTR